jgi:hypothetical protein
MPILRDRNGEQVLYLHIPKTAGTSLKSNLRSDVELVFDVEFKKELPCPPQHFHLEILARLGVTKICSSNFAIVRHPIDRFVSEYTYRKKIDPKFKYVSFSAFFIFCKHVYANNPYLLANHIRLQSDFIDEKTQIFKLEHGISSVFEAYPSFFDESNSEPDRKNTSASKLLEIDKTIFEGLKVFYLKDFTELGYQPESTAIKIVPHSIISYFLSWIVGISMAIVYKIKN